MTGLGNIFENIWSLRQSFFNLSVKNCNLNFEYYCLLTPKVELSVCRPFCAQRPENTGPG